jgi:FkbM family methyltransferase
MNRMISYAQNREDVLLHRVLANCRYRYYVDVGAGHPTIHSVTRYFHDQGWQGVNIEPRPEMHRLLCLSRTRDVNLRVGIADKPGADNLRLVSVDGVSRAEGGGLSTFDPNLAEAQRDLGRGVESIPTDTRTLTSIFEELSLQAVSFLKIDVEGYEFHVIAGMDWQKWRPRVVLVEAIHPITQQQNHQLWEPILTRNGFLPAHWDGLNRFYVREEDRDLLPLFASPVSVLDDFVAYESLRLWEQIAQLRNDNTRVLNAMTAQQMRASSKTARRVRVC